ncbi:hypothetical protein JJD41_19085 [Oxynema sp. CENA135]|uniref:hypothetical protein n=1 Tax=Oxynema sp. CENA135 TaxID=984206 RepID=UPI00190C628E|nr:hypothetical protein [Oxynema sp. CENA135]MBK4731959.1 hypothetical protein [Oxynema sp. CENA135]
MSPSGCSAIAPRSPSWFLLDPLNPLNSFLSHRDCADPGDRLDRKPTMPPFPGDRPLNMLNFRYSFSQN